MPRLFPPVTIGLVVLFAGTGMVTSIGDMRSPTRSLRVMTLNAQAGTGSHGLYDLNRLASVIAAADPDVVGLQEMTRNHAEYRCDDQPARVVERLRAITGKPWTHVYVREWLTSARECVNTGRGDEVTTEGLVLLAPEPLVGVESIELWNGRIGLAARVAKAPEVAVIVTHLASGGANRGDRVKQLDALVPWAEGRARASILMGDFNAEASASELAPLRARYRDAWSDAQRAGTAYGVASGSTRPTKQSRIDFVMYAPDGALSLEWAQVVDTSVFPFASEVSDHRPVLASFTLNDEAGHSMVRDEGAPIARR